MNPGLFLTDCDTLCPLEKFAQIMNPSIPIDIRKACGIEELVPASQAAVQKGKFQNQEPVVSMQH